MIKFKEPITYARAACDTMMRRYRAKDLPPRGHFHYHQGIFLSGVYKTYLLCKEEAYFNYMKEWVDAMLDEEGNVINHSKGELDDIQPGILLYPLLDRTGEERYRKALDKLLPVILNFPRNEAGGIWHKEALPNQMWLDGLYMAGPICAEYAKRFHKPEYYKLIVQHALLMEKHTRDERTGLFYHAWDSSKKESWADPKTGLSPEFWGRSIGWVPVAVLDDLDFMEPGQEGYEELCALVQNLLISVCRYQSEDGRWYQVLDKGDQDGNWLENSCSCLFVAALCKAIRKGILKKDYSAFAGRGFQGVVNSLNREGEDLLIGDICIGTGVGDYKHYCERPVCVNDLHGAGAFLLMCYEAQQALEL